MAGVEQGDQVAGELGGRHGAAVLRIHRPGQDVEQRGRGAGAGAPLGRLGFHLAEEPGAGRGGAAARRIGRPGRRPERGHRGDPRQGGDQGVHGLAIGLEVHREALTEQGLDDHLQGDAGHVGDHVHRRPRRQPPPALDLAAGGAIDGGRQAEQQLMPERRRQRAAMPAPVGPLGQDHRMLAEHRGQHLARRIVAAELVHARDQHLLDQVRIGDEDGVGDGRAVPHHARLVVEGPGECLDDVAEQRPDAGRAGRLERDQLGIIAHGLRTSP